MYHNIFEVPADDEVEDEADEEDNMMDMEDMMDMMDGEEDEEEPAEQTYYHEPVVQPYYTYDTAVEVEDEQDMAEEDKPDLYHNIFEVPEDDEEDEADEADDTDEADEADEAVTTC